MKKKKDYFEQFLGQNVNVITKFMRKEHQQEGETSMSAQEPLVLGGILIDFDDDFFYIGDEDGDIQQAISRVETIALQVDPNSVKSDEEMPERADLN